MLKLEELNLNNLKIYQDDALYKFTSDSVLLSKFAVVKKGDVVADFCSGSGIVGFHLYGLNPCIKSMHFFEMQTELYALSQKSIEVNGLKDNFFAVNTKIQDIDSSFNEKFSLIVCNPPYMEEDRGASAEFEKIAVCKQELSLTLESLIKAVSKALRYKGRFCMIHRADRLVDIIYTMRKFNVEPKRLQFVSGGKKEPYALMVEGVKGGKSGIKIQNTIVNG